MSGLSPDERDDLIRAIFDPFDDCAHNLADLYALVDQIANARVEAALEAAAVQIDAWSDMHQFGAISDDPESAQRSVWRARCYRRAARIVRAAADTT